MTPTRTVSAKSYSYSTEKRTHASGGFDEPQPYRSPSPVSFPQKRSPSPTKRTLNRNDSGRNVSYQVSTLIEPFLISEREFFFFTFSRFYSSRFHLKPLKILQLSLISMRVTLESKVDIRPLVMKRRILTGPCRDLFPLLLPCRLASRIRLRNSMNLWLPFKTITSV